LRTSRSRSVPAIAAQHTLVEGKRPACHRGPAGNLVKESQQTLAYSGKTLANI